VATNKKCFVIIGYEKKTSYANGKQRLLDLDQTFTILIKPVFDALGIDCYRAIDKNLTGSIDKLMLEEIKEADIALVDLSTLNANVMWELGVRHALKPRYTIMICEKEQMSSIPFDVKSFVIHEYVHSEQGIPYTEVERFRKHLTKIVEGVLKQDPPGIDSPVHTFLADASSSGIKTLKADTAMKKPSFATVMKDAENCKNEKRYGDALELLAEAKEFALANMSLKDNLSLIICRQALNTYKLEKPNKLEAFVKAKAILDELKPDTSQDTEVLGLSGAISKRLFELTGDSAYLDSASNYYEKGFHLKQDYYNGINAAFMLYKKASMLKSQHKDWDDVKIKADYIRNSVLDISLKLEAAEKFSETGDAIWVLLTIAEAYNYKANETKLAEYEQKAAQMAALKNDSFAMSSYEEQKNKIKPIFEIINTK
jgi:hypothetical protein